MAVLALATPVLMAAAEYSLLYLLLGGGLGGAIAETLMESGVIPRFFLRIGLRNTFSSVVGSQQYLRNVYSLDAAALQGLQCRQAPVR